METFFFSFFSFSLSHSLHILCMFFVLPYNLAGRVILVVVVLHSAFCSFLFAVCSASGALTKKVTRMQQQSSRETSITHIIIFLLLPMNVVMWCFMFSCLMLFTDTLTHTFIYLYDVLLCMLLPESDSTFFSLILWKYNEFYGTLWYSLYEKLVYKSTSCDYEDVVSCKKLWIFTYWPHSVLCAFVFLPWCRCRVLSIFKIVRI